MRGHSTITGCGTTIRRILSMATIPAVRANPAIRDSNRGHQVGSGRPARAALATTMRKLVTVPAPSSETSEYGNVHEPEHIRLT
jgi:hypothetical protein